MTKFKGKGEHSVQQLETIILELQEELHNKQITIQELDGLLKDSKDTIDDLDFLIRNL